MKPRSWPRQLTIPEEGAIQLGSDFLRTAAEFEEQAALLEWTIRDNLSWLWRANQLVRACEEDAAGELALGTCRFYLISAARLENPLRVRTWLGRGGGNEMVARP